MDTGIVRHAQSRFHYSEIACIGCWMRCTRQWSFNLLMQQWKNIFLCWHKMCRYNQKYNIMCWYVFSDYMCDVKDVIKALYWYSYIPYTAKLSRGKTFVVVHQPHHSLENFRSASGWGHHVLYTVNDSRGKLLQLAKNRESFPLQKFCRIR